MKYDSYLILLKLKDAKLNIKSRMKSGKVIQEDGKEAKKM